MFLIAALSMNIQRYPQKRTRTHRLGYFFSGCTCFRMNLRELRVTKCLLTRALQTGNTAQYKIGRTPLEGSGGETGSSIIG